MKTDFDYICCIVKHEIQSFLFLTCVDVLIEEKICNNEYVQGRDASPSSRLWNIFKKNCKRVLETWKAGKSLRLFAEIWYNTEEVSGKLIGWLSLGL